MLPIVTVRNTRTGDSERRVPDAVACVLARKYRPTNQQYYENEWLSTDHHHVDNITDKDIDLSDYEKYLSFLQKEDLHGLSIAKSIPWQLSGVIQFPSHQLHSGSTFEGSKRWLLIASVTNT